MQEFKSVRQDEHGFKRLFLDDTFDLYVWYDNKGGEITGFQLVYDKVIAPRAITWIKGKGFRHNRINGYDSSYFNQTPILAKDGVFEIQAISSAFQRHCIGVDEDISKLVYDTLKQYDPEMDNQFI
jgi:hypothetical protein